MDSLIVLSKVIILAVMIAITLGALYLSSQLRRLTAPMARQLAQLHQSELDAEELGMRLQAIKDRYIALLTYVDNVDTAEFSAGEIETISLRFGSRELTAAAAQSWLRQAPGILISIGLLGTFAGLTIGLTQVSDALGQEATPAETMTALSGIVAPMGAAFQTSLLGLFLSLLVLIWTQLAGTRDCLIRCESLLSSWLETVLPQQLGNKVMTPLRQSIQTLNSSVRELPVTVYSAVQEGMKEAFSAKLNDIFNVNSNLALEAQGATRQLAAIASALNESGQDFVQAAQAFRQSDFASSLQQSVSSLLTTREQLTESSESLCERLCDVRDNLSAIQSEWRLLAKAAEQELVSCRSASVQIQGGINTLSMAVRALEQCSQSVTDSTKQLREARLEVMRDRKLAIGIAESVQRRLASDSSYADSCQVFASSLETALSNWNRNVERLDRLSASYIDSVQNARLEDEQILTQRSKAVRETLDALCTQLQTDLGAAIETQRREIADLGKPTQSAQEHSQRLLQQLDELQVRLTRMVGNQQSEHSDS